MEDGGWKTKEEKGRPETGGLKAEGSETADGQASAARNPRSFDRHGGLRYQLIAKATYLVRRGGLRYQLIAKATYLVRHGGLRFRLLQDLRLSVFSEA